MRKEKDEEGLGKWEGNEESVVTWKLRALARCYLWVRVEDREVAAGFHDGEATSYRTGVVCHAEVRASLETE